MLKNLVHNFMAAGKFPRWRWALLIAVVSDALVFAVVLLPPVQGLLDAVTAGALSVAIGFRWQLFPALAVEAVPALQLFPAWTLAVLAMSATTTQTSPDAKKAPETAANPLIAFPLNRKNKTL